METLASAGDGTIVNPSGCGGTAAVYTALAREVENNIAEAKKSNIVYIKES